jgi:prephenate dehydratase
MALPGQRMDGIKTVYSHPQALAQCEDFLVGLGAEIIPGYDTAGSAKMIAEKRKKGCAAVASKRAASIYGLEILASEIETNVDNYTKFLAISKQESSQGKRDKTSLVFAAKNVPGALHDILGIFASRNINLTKLESRPSRSKPWEYVFYVDFEGHPGEEVYPQAIRELEQQAAFVKLLGSYPRAE